MACDKMTEHDKKLNSKKATQQEQLSYHWQARSESHKFLKKHMKCDIGNRILLC